MRSVVVAGFMLVAASPVAAGQSSPPAPSVTARFGALRLVQPSNPYSKLFEVREALKQAVEQQSKNAAPVPRKKVVCGMTVIEVGPELDPKMGVTPPKDDKVTYTIRAIEPPICNASTAK